MACQVEFDTWQRFHLIGKIIYPALGQKRQPPIIFGAFQMDIRLPAGIIIELTAIIAFDEILIRLIIQARTQLPVVSQVLSVQPTESTTKFFIRFKIPSAVVSAEPVFVIVAYYIATDCAVIIFVFILNTRSYSDATLAVIIQQQCAVYSLRLPQA